MKKFLFSFILFLLVLLNFKLVNAEDSWFTHSPVNYSQLPVNSYVAETYNSNFSQFFELDNLNLDNNTEGIFLHIPSSGDMLLSDAGINSTVTFYDINHVEITGYRELPLNDFKVDGGDLTIPTGDFYFSLINIGTELQNFIVDRIFINIPTVYTSIPAGGWGAYIYNNTIATRKIYGNLDYNLIWNLENLNENYHFIFADITIQKEWNLSQLFISNSSYHVGKYEKYQYYSKVEYYNKTDQVICVYDMSQEINFNKILNVNPKDNNCNIHIDSINRLRIKILQKPFALDLNETDYLNYINENTVIAFNIPLYLVNVYNGSKLIKQNTFVRNELTGLNLPYFSLSELPVATNIDLIFNNFAYSSGTEYKMKYQIIDNKYYFYGLNLPDEDYYDNNTLNLYANFGLRAINSSVNKNVDSRLNTVINALSLDTVAGYLFIYFIVLIISNIALFLYLHNNMIVLIVNLAITGFFTFLGVFTILILILLYSVIFSLFLLELRRE